VQQTISENFLRLIPEDLTTLNISCLLFQSSTVKVKTLSGWSAAPFTLKMHCKKNSQVTKAFNSWVGTSEAIRLLAKKTLIRSNPMLRNRWVHCNKQEERVTPIVPKQNKEWLAGLIDGDGSFLLSKKGYASLEITMDLRDEHALQIIKNIYGGSIKLRSGAKTLRYRLHHKSGLIKIIHDVNGYIRNSNRMVQLNKICIKYNIDLIHPENLEFENGWLSGFFDADGTISINSSNWQLSLTASQKTYELLQPLVDIYGGYIYIDRGSSKSFKWYVTKRETISKLIEYFKKHPSRSAKQKRLHLVPNYYKLKDLKAHKASDPYSILAKSWKTFICKWFKYEDS
jgi:LAGLIDADG endonuclease